MGEYEEDELADDSDNEKRLFRAEVRAGRKLKQKDTKEARKKGGPPRKPFRSSWPSPAPWSGEHAHNSSAAAVPVTPGLQLMVPQFLSQLRVQPSDHFSGYLLARSMFFCVRSWEDLPSVAECLTL